MQYVRPVNIASPVTGALCKPRIHKIKRGNKIYEEAHWYCPDSGAFIKKGIINILEEAKDDPYSDSGTNAAREGVKGHLKANPKQETGLPDENKQMVAEGEQRILKLAEKLEKIPSDTLKKALEKSHPEMTIVIDENTGELDDGNHLGKSGTQNARDAAVKFSSKPKGSYYKPQKTGGFPSV